MKNINETKFSKLDFSGMEVSCIVGLLSTRIIKFKYNGNNILFKTQYVGTDKSLVEDLTSKISNINDNINRFKMSDDFIKFIKDNVSEIDYTYINRNTTRASVDEDNIFINKYFDDIKTRGLIMEDIMESNYYKPTSTGYNGFYRRCKCAIEDIIYYYSTKKKYDGLIYNLDFNNKDLGLRLSGVGFEILNNGIINYDKSFNLESIDYTNITDIEIAYGFRDKDNFISEKCNFVIRLFYGFDAVDRDAALIFIDNCIIEGQKYNSEYFEHDMNGSYSHSGLLHSYIMQRNNIKESSYTRDCITDFISEEEEDKLVYGEKYMDYTVFRYTDGFVYALDELINKLKTAYKDEFFMVWFDNATNNGVSYRINGGNR
ncbi:MAG: hypothetical protein ACRCXT_02385 [Paraclostridium sp.]